MNGLFTSPLYPYNYPNNTVCNYTITVAMGFRIHLYFPKFALEKHDSCLNDNLRIYEGPDMKSPLGEMLCGEYENKQFISATNQLFLQLTTNDKISKNGFHANYYTTRLCEYHLIKISFTFRILFLLNIFLFFHTLRRNRRNVEFSMDQNGSAKYVWKKIKKFIWFSIN